jgi:uncharacterized membrane protein (UPF0136 family)
MRHHLALYSLGLYFIFAGLAGYLSNPEKAKTALISGAVFGTLSLILGALSFKGSPWGRRLGLGLCTMLSAVFAWRASVSWAAVIGGQAEKTFAASLILSMFLMTVVTLVFLIKKAK